MSQGTGDRGVPRKAAAVDRTADRSYAAVGQALASVTNDPRAGSDAWFGFKSAQDTSWKTPPPPLDPAKYPNVTRADLKRFLKIVGHGQYEQLMEDRRSMAEDLSAEQLLAAGKGTRASAGSSSSSAQGDGLTQALQAVPAQYFKDDFSLQKPGVLQALIDLGGSGGDGGELASSIDRLSGYLESVETNLMREIGCRSNSMFEAAGSLQELHHSLCMNLDQIRGLREHLRSMDAQTYTSALQVSGLQKRRARLALALEQLGSMEEVVASRGALQCLLDAQDYAGALELLSNLRHLVGRQLSMGVRAFRETSPQVEETIEIVESLLSCEFLSLARHPDIHSVMERAISDAGADAEADMDDDGTGTMPHSHHIHGPSGGDARAAREQLHDKLLPLVVGLFRAAKLEGVLLQQRDNAGADAKATVREVLDRMVTPLLHAAGIDPASVMQGGGGGGSTMAESLAALPHPGFMQILSVLGVVFTAEVEHLHMLGSQCEEVLRSARASQQTVDMARRGVAAALQALVDSFHSRCTRVLATRGTSLARLRLREFQALSCASEVLLAVPEGVGARASGAMKTAIQGQCRAYLDSIHAKGLNQLNQLLEGEQWVAVEVPPSVQGIADRIVARCDLLAAGAPDDRAQQQALHGGSNGEVTTSDAAAGGAGGANSQAQLSLLGRRFHVVTSGVILLKILDEYLLLQEAVPLFGVDVAQRAVELIKTFNAATCQLVLGAGAMRSAGLKSISAKHLAVSCQAIHMLAHLLPKLRAGLVALVPSQRWPLLLPEFDRLMQDLSLHLDEIHTKLVDIMQDRLQLAASQLVAEAEVWGAAPGAAGAMVGDAVRGLVKSLGTLRAVLSPILQQEEVAYIFGRVASLYSETLAHALDGLKPVNQAWEERRKANTLALLQCLVDMPMDPSLKSAYTSRLSTFYTKHYGLMVDSNRPAVKQQQAQAQAQQAALEQQQAQQQQQAAMEAASAAASQHAAASAAASQHAAASAAASQHAEQASEPQQPHDAGHEPASASEHVPQAQAAASERQAATTEPSEQQPEPAAAGSSAGDEGAAVAHAEDEEAATQRAADGTAAEVSSAALDGAGVGGRSEQGAGADDGAGAEGVGSSGDDAR